MFDAIQSIDLTTLDKHEYRIAFLAMHNFNLASFSAAIHALNGAKDLSSGPAFCPSLIGLTPDIRSDVGISLHADLTLAKADLSAYDTIIVCGGPMVILQSNLLIMTKLQDAEKAKRVLGGIWNGAFFLAEAGLTTGYDCLFSGDGRFLLIPPRDPLAKSATYLADGNRLCCSNPTGAASMMTALIDQCSNRSGYTTAQMPVPETFISHSFQRPAAQLPSHYPTPLKIALEIMHENISNPIAIENISKSAGVSRRQMERIFQKYKLNSPNEQYVEIRLKHAAGLLKKSRQSLMEIANACGFASATHFQRRFRRLYSTTPERFRKVRAEEFLHLVKPQHYKNFI